MKQLISVAISLGFAWNLFAVSYGTPERHEIISPDQHVKFIVNPPLLHNVLEFLSLRDGQYSALYFTRPDLSGRELICEGIFMLKKEAGYAVFWRRPLRNPVAPSFVRILNTERGYFVVTFHDWASPRTEYSIVIYNMNGAEICAITNDTILRIHPNAAGLIKDMDVTFKGFTLDTENSTLALTFELEKLKLRITANTLQLSEPKVELREEGDDQ